MKKHKSLFFKSATKKRLLWVYLVTSIPLLVCILLGMRVRQTSSAAAKYTVQS